MTGCLLNSIRSASGSPSSGTGDMAPDIDTFAHVGSCMFGKLLNTLVYGSPRYSLAEAAPAQKNWELPPDLFADKTLGSGFLPD